MGKRITILVLNARRQVRARWKALVELSTVWTLVGSVVLVWSSNGGTMSPYLRIQSRRIVFQLVFARTRHIGGPCT